MNRSEKEHYRELLERQLGEIDHTIEIMKENNSAQQDKFSPTELSNYDNHPAEMATELFQVELNSALKVHEEKILQEVKDAIGRIERGTYGTCAHCGTQIAAQRLEVLPYASLCARCADEAGNEPARQHKGRPNEEKVLDAPFGRKYLNKQEDDEHEGMDQLKDLMKYGSSDSPQDLSGYYDYEEYYTNEVDKQGIVDDMDQLSNEDYKRQLPN